MTDSSGVHPQFLHQQRGSRASHHVFSMAIVLLHWAMAATALAQATADGILTLAAAEERALGANPGLAAVREQAIAMATMVPQEGTLPDPVLGLNALNLPVDTFDLDQEPMTQLQVSLTQAVPFPGKLGLKRAAAEHQAAASSAAVAERRLSVRAEVRTTWWRLFTLDRSLEILRENQALMRDFIEVAQTKYKVGAGLQQDVLLAQLELSRLLDRGLQLSGRREATAAGMNALLDQPAGFAVHLPAAIPNTLLPELAGEAAMLERAVESRPLLIGQRELVDAARSRVDLARRDYYPDFRLGAAYGFRETHDRVTGETLPDFFSVMLSINVPVYASSRQSKAVDQRGSELNERRHLLGEALRSVEASIARNRSHYLAAREQALLFSTAILPQARQTVESMLAGYQVNEVDFLNVVNAELRLLDAQVAYWEAFGAAKQALARLAAAVGEDVVYE